MIYPLALATVSLYVLTKTSAFTKKGINVKKTNKNLNTLFILSPILNNNTNEKIIQ